MLVVGIIIGILFLEETHEELKHEIDYGRRAGEKLAGLFKIKGSTTLKYEGLNTCSSPLNGEMDALLASTGIAYSSEEANQNADRYSGSARAPFMRSFTPPVVALIVSYAILAYHSMGFEQLMPIFLATPRAERPPSDVFRFTGGLGMGSQAIGFILTMQGGFSMITQFFIFPPIAGSFGVLRVYRFCMWTYAFSYVLVPYINFLPEGLQLSGVYLVLAIKILYGVLAYPCNAILLTNSAPSLLVLGLINGVAASCASLARSLSPTVTGMIHSYGLKIGIVGLAWWLNALVCVIGGIQCIGLQTEDFKRQNTEELTREVDNETAEHIAVEVQVAHTVVRGEECFDQYSTAKKAIDDELATLNQSEL